MSESERELVWIRGRDYIYIYFVFLYGFVFWNINYCDC